MGTPQEIYYHPQSEFVADFIGEANFLRGTLVSKKGDRGEMELAGGRISVEGVGTIDQGAQCSLVLRPESAVIAEEGQLPCEVTLSCFMGSYQNYEALVDGKTVKITDFNPKHKRIFNVGEKAFIRFDPNDIHVLEA